MVFPVVGGNESKGYEISNSIRFNDGDTPKFHLTQDSSINSFEPKLPSSVIELKDNRMVIFLSQFRHEVSEIKMHNNQPAFSGLGRFCLTNFVRYST